MVNVIAALAIIGCAKAAVIDVRAATTTSSSHSATSTSSSHSATSTSSSKSATSTSSSTSTIGPTLTVETIVTTVVETPQYFQTTPELYAGTTATGSAAFLAETNPAPFASVSYIPPAPLETQVPISGNTEDANIFHNLGNIGPYAPAKGFGVQEYSLPAGSNITWLNMLSRHGSRYPTSNIGLAAAIANVSSSANFTGALDFLNTWTYRLGNNILTPWGRQELYDSGVLHNYLYGHLYPNNGSKILVRSTTQDRMVKSAENFLAGFFGLSWTNNATLELIIDTVPFNNSLAGYNACANNNNYRSSAGANASDAWIATYLANATSRFNALSTGFQWTPTYLYDAQELCAYETVALGYSAFCDLFTYQEWLNFEQAIDIDFAGTYAFQSPTGRAVGVGYVEEVLARLNHHLITTATASDNITLDSMEDTFPTNQALNLDFTHDVNIAAVLTAFGLTQFSGFISDKVYQPNRTLVVSQMEPFGARLDIELIKTPYPVLANRTRTNVYDKSGNGTTYIHFILNQRTVPLGASFAACGARLDGWCELSTFLEIQSDALAISNYTYACNGDYAAPAYGAVTNGVPIS